MYVINLDGVIGQDLTAKNLRSKLEIAGFDPVRIDVNCPGGSVFEGLAMRQVLLDHPGTVTARIVSLAASMATALLTACSSIEVFSDSIFMMHRVSGSTWGTSEDHKKTGSVLANLDRILAEHYAAQSGKTVNEILRLMTKETWLYGHEIVREGFADDFTERQTKKSREAALAEARSRFAACYRQPREDEKMRIAAFLGGPGTPESMEPELKAELAKWDTLYGKGRSTPAGSKTKEPTLQETLDAWDRLYGKKEAH